MRPVLLLAFAISASAQTFSPVVIRQADPVYPPGPFLADIVHARIVVDEKGVPFELKDSSEPLPDNVVEAIMEWRYQPGKPFVMDSRIPVRRPLNADVERSSRWLWRSDQSAGSEQRTAEQILSSNQSQPAAYSLGSPMVIIDKEDPAYASIHQEWLDQVEAFPNDLAVAQNAFNFLRVSDPVAAEKIALSTAARFSTAQIWLGNLYGMAVLGVHRLSPKSGLPVAAVDPPPDDPFVVRARHTLLDPNAHRRLLLAALMTISDGGRSLAQAGQLPQSYQRTCEDVLNNVKRFYSNPSTTGDAHAPLAEEFSTAWSRITHPQVRKQHDPDYPPEASRRGVTGSVVVKILITANGDVTNVALVKGPLMLYKAARDAVRKWTFKPGLRDGHPASVPATVEVNFDMKNR